MHERTKTETSTYQKHGGIAQEQNVNAENRNIITSKTFFVVKNFAYTVVQKAKTKKKKKMLLMVLTMVYQLFHDAFRWD